MTARVLLAVDFSNVLYRATAAYKLLSFEGTFTGGLYGFLAIVAAAIDRTQATDIVLCRDSKPYRRSAVYPDYKLLRGKTQDPEMRELYKASEPLVLELADRFGLPVWAAPGFEADDLVAHVVVRHRGRWARIVSLSNDSDIWQLFAYPQFRVYKDPKLPLLDGKVLDGLTPEQYVLTLALSGTHNEIQGLPDIGPKRSRAIVTTPAKLRDAMQQHGDLIARNTALIRLPHPELAAVCPPMPRATKGRFYFRDLYRWAAKYDITITPTMTNSLERVL